MDDQKPLVSIQYGVETNAFERIWKRIFKSYQPPVLATCMDCGECGVRTTMAFAPGYGWFCNQEHAQSFWEFHQW